MGSRELNLIKKHGYVPPSGLTGKDTSKHIKNAMTEVESMAIASCSIDQPMMASSSSAKQPEQGFSLWNAMNAVLGPTPPQTGHAEADTGVAFGGSKNSSKKVSSKHTSKRKKKKRSDGGSIISSFF